MSWAFLDDRANENEKLLAVGGAAAWYWACGLMYCRRKEQERRQRGERPDFIPGSQALVLFPDPKARQHIKALVRERLWHVAEGGYLVNDYRKVYGTGQPQPPTEPVQPNQPAGHQPTPSQLGGKARAAQASRGPAGTFQPKSSRLDQPSQPHARQDPDPTPEDPKENTTIQDLSGHGAGARGDGAGDEDRLVLGYVTECPPRLVELCAERGLIASLAVEHGATEADVEQAIRQYGEHFQKGRGFGEKRSGWMRHVRGRVLDLARSGRLAGLALAGSTSESGRDDTGGFGASDSWESA